MQKSPKKIFVCVCAFYRNRIRSPWQGLKHIAVKVMEEASIKKHESSLKQLCSMYPNRECIDLHFLDYLERVCLNALVAFVCGSNIYKTLFCWWERLFMPVNNDCNSWYIKLDNFMMWILNRTRKICTVMQGLVFKVSCNNPISKC